MNDETPIAQASSQQQFDIVGPCHRIDWLADTADAKDSFQPADPSWLARLDVIAEKLAGDAYRQSTWLISSVRRDALRLLQDHLDTTIPRASSDRIPTTEPERFFTGGCHVLSFRDIPIGLAIRSPERVGVDRLLAAYAASRLVTERPLVVIQVGSAVTVDLVLRDSMQLPEENQLDTQAWASSTRGRRERASQTECSEVDQPLPEQTTDVFAGGAILPGIPMMLRLLGKAADMLPEIDFGEMLDLPTLPGRDTEEAMRCGTASAVVGGTVHLVDRYRQQFGAELPVVIGGGDGLRLAPHIAPPAVIANNLVHLGMRDVAQLIIT